jgi:hypothetical protein
MTLHQIVSVFFVVGALLTLGTMFDVLTVLDDAAVAVAGVCAPVVDPIFRALGLL